MHSYEERMKAVQLFIKYDLSVADSKRQCARTLTTEYGLI